MGYNLSKAIALGIVIGIIAFFIIFAIFLKHLSKELATSMQSMIETSSVKSERSHVWSDNRLDQPNC